MPLPRVDSPERHAAIRASVDLALVKSTARFHRLSVRRLRWGVEGRICFALQDRGDPYREWSRHGRVYLHEDGSLDVERTRIYGEPVREVIGLVTAIATDSIGQKVACRTRPFGSPSPQPIRVAVGSEVAVYGPAPAPVDPVVAIAVTPLPDGIIGDLAASDAEVPLLVEEVRNPATGAIEILVTETYLPDLVALVAEEPAPEWIDPEPEARPDHRRRNSWVEFFAGIILAIAAVAACFLLAVQPSLGWAALAVVGLAIGVPLVGDAIRRNDALHAAQRGYLIQGKELEWTSS